MDILKNTFDEYFERVSDWLSFEIHIFLFRHSMHGVRSTMRDYNVHVYKYWISQCLCFFKVSWTYFSNNFNKLQSYHCWLSETQNHAKTLKQLWSCKKKQLTVSFQFLYLHIICRMGNNIEEKLKINIRVNFCDMTSLIINTKIYQERYCRPSFVKMWPSRQFSVFLRIC